MVGTQHHALAQRGVRQALEGRRDGDGRGQAGRAVHPDERHGDPEQRGHPGELAQRGRRGHREAARHRPDRLGLEPVAAPLLAQGLTGLDRPEPRNYNGPPHVGLSTEGFMDERALRNMIDEVKSGRLSRRHFVQTMVGLGLTAPLAAQMLASAGVAQAQSKLNYKPTKRGGGGALKVLWWQGATLLNPHFATGTKDQDGSRIFYEPLASWDANGNLCPILAAEIPSIQNGGLAADGKSREAPTNLKPVGTGPYRFVDFKPGDIVRGELNPNYHMPNRPHFDTIEVKGGGDATSAARAVPRTGEFDYAWNMQ